MRLLVFMLLLLTACGGGAPAISFYGDSLTSGSIEGGWLDPRPVQRMTELSGGAFVGVDYSHPGMTVWDAVEGTADALPWDTAMQRDTAQFVAIRYAGSALARPGQLRDYERVLETMIRIAQGHHKTVVLLGFPWMAVPDDKYGISPADSARIMASVDEFEAATQALALRMGVVFIEVRKVPFYGKSDVADIIHPNQGYSDRMSAFIVERLIASLSLR